MEGEILGITSIIDDVTVNLLRLAVIELPADVKEALKKATNKREALSEGSSWKRSSKISGWPRRKEDHYARTQG